MFELLVSEVEPMCRFDSLGEQSEVSQTFKKLNCSPDKNFISYNTSVQDAMQQRGDNGFADCVVIPCS